MLRKLAVRDTERMLEWMHDPSVNSKFRFRFDEMDSEKVADFINNSFDDKSQHFAFTNDNDEYLGTISLKNISYEDKNAEYAIVTRLDAQGTGSAFSATMGLLQYAFQELGLHRVYLNVLEENERANRFYVKCGFSYEGKFIDHLFLRDGFRNLNWYGIQSDDFSKVIASNIVYPISEFNLFLRPVTMDDAKTLFEWANNPETRRNSFSTSRIEWDEHLKWLRQKLTDKNSKLFILSNGIERIGTVRLDFQASGEYYLISYSVGPCFRGSGYGTKLLELAEEQAKKMRNDKIKATQIIGEVKCNNYVSIHCFEKAGFLKKEENQVKIIFCKSI